MRSDVLEDEAALSAEEDAVEGALEVEGVLEVDAATNVALE